MKPDPNRDYSRLTQFAANCGMVPWHDRMGNICPGFYTLEGKQAPVDLTACAEDEKSILKTALVQLSEEVTESWHNAIEKDLQD